MEPLLFLALLSPLPHGSSVSLRSAAEMNTECAYQAGACLRSGEWTNGMARDAAFEFLGQALFPEGGLSVSVDGRGAARVFYRRDF